ncbi:TauD/TfdA dioxygenase family protein [Acinetobacter puyangensis]|uniref:TauD/TfdA dioxygenase family protein n=1 Tax=Acinetobacter puyangensis TaxID=1096779 RepID=UPI003A4D459A
MNAIINQQQNTLEIIPVAGRIGAEIRGVTIAANLDSEVIKQIHQAILDYKVVFFRGQNHVEDTIQENFAALFGNLVKHPTVPSIEGATYLREWDSKRGDRANVWHTDVTFIDAYPKFCFLRGVVIPAAGGDTMWANTETAYDDLPEILKDLSHQLRAIHTNAHDYSSLKSEVNAAQIEKYKKVFASTVYETEHPLVRIHPETGRKGLVLGQFFKKFLDLNPKDSSRLFEVFQEKVTRPENVVRWQWTQGDLVIWDNRATQHYAVADFGDAHRVVRRVTVMGDVPVGVDGRKSQILIPHHLSSDELEKAKTDLILASN